MPQLIMFMTDEHDEKEWFDMSLHMLQCDLQITCQSRIVLRVWIKIYLNYYHNLLSNHLPVSGRISLVRYILGYKGPGVMMWLIQGGSYWCELFHGHIFTSIGWPLSSDSVKVHRPLVVYINIFNLQKKKGYLRISRNWFCNLLQWLGIIFFTFCPCNRKFVHVTISPKLYQYHSMCTDYLYKYIRYVYGSQPTYENYDGHLCMTSDICIFTANWKISKTINKKEYLTVLNIVFYIF